MICRSRNDNSGFARAPVCCRRSLVSAVQLSRARRATKVAPELCKIAVGQLRATATFYREGFARAVGDNPEARDEGAKVARAISELADNIEKLSQSATGSPRLGREYATTFRLGTGINEPAADVLKRATADLAAKRSEAANFRPEGLARIDDGQAAARGRRRFAPPSVRTGGRRPRYERRNLRFTLEDRCSRDRKVLCGRSGS